MTHTSVRETLDLVEKYLPSQLIDLGALVQLRETATRVPERVASSFFLECRLLNEARAVDLAIVVPRSVLQSWDGPVPDTDFEAHEELLRRLHHLTSTSGLPTDALYAMCLEYDAPDGSSQACPGIYVQLDSSKSGSEHTVIRAATRALVDVSGAQADVRDVLDCVNMLPEGAYVLHIGVFPARSATAIRLVIQGIDDDAVPGFLKRAGWSGSTADLRDFMASTLPRPHATHPNRVAGIAFDVIGARVGPRIGLEYPVNGMVRFGRERLAEPFLQQLVALGLCSEEKRSSLQDWPGLTLEQAPGRDLILVLRTVNHAKIVHEPSRAPEAKAYLLALAVEVPPDPRQRARILEHLNGEGIGQIINEPAHEPR